jgi:hypothetical protein
MFAVCVCVTSAMRVCYEINNWSPINVLTLKRAP